ncbi:MAG: transglycosylase SLT domain-containing protein [Patescibacteria group bacterium]
MSAKAPIAAEPATPMTASETRAALESVLPIFPDILPPDKITPPNKDEIPIPPVFSDEDSLVYEIDPKSGKASARRATGKQFEPPRRLAPKNSKRVAEIEELADRFSFENRVNPVLTLTLIEIESDFDPNAENAGAQGLMQLKPTTVENFGVSDLFDPEQNIKGGTLYLAYLNKKYGWKNALIAFCCGENTLKNYLRTGKLPEAAKRYMRKVERNYHARLKKLPIVQVEYQGGQAPYWEALRNSHRNRLAPDFWIRKSPEPRTPFNFSRRRTG